MADVLMMKMSRFFKVGRFILGGNINIVSHVLSLMLGGILIPGGDSNQQPSDYWTTVLLVTK